MGKNIYLQVVDHLNDSPSPVLATIVGKRGSAPQVPGSSAIFGAEGLIAGTVGGGAVEGKITEIAGARLRSRESGYINFNLVNDISRKEDAICGGQLSILVDAMPSNSAATFREIRESLIKNQTGILLTLVNGLHEKGASVERYWITRQSTPAIPQAVMDAAGLAIGTMMSSSEPAGLIEIEVPSPVKESVMIFLEKILPSSKLVIAGAGHIGKALSHLGNMLGFDVTVIDDRPEFANTDNLPHANHIIVKDISTAVREINKDADTFMAIVTRGHKDDAEALKQCIGSDLAYTGMIGSRHKINAMREEFIGKGWATPEQWSQIYTPIGLEINSQTIEEIAVSIAAELIMVRNSNTGKRKSCPS